MNAGIAEEIRAIVDGEGTWVDKLDRIIKLEKEKNGLIGICGITTFSKDGKEVDPEEVAKGVCLMHLADLEGKFRDVTGEEL